MLPKQPLFHYVRPDGFVFTTNQFYCRDYLKILGVELSDITISGERKWKDRHGNMRALVDYVKEFEIEFPVNVQSKEFTDRLLDEIQRG